jgi:preprotein translocase subunit SecA
MKFDFGSIPARIGKALQGVFGSANKRALSRYQPIVRAVNALADEIKALSKEEIQAQVAAMKQKVMAGETTLDDCLPRMFALTREAATRTLGIRHFDVQLIGGAVLHGGNIAEMATGEGKTLVATLPAALNAIAGKGVFVVTVNDYLARRDCEWMSPVYEYLGLKALPIQSQMSPQERQPAYAADITYGTNNEFGFDYLRDNMKWRVEDQVQKNLFFAIVDEVDSILVDEARTPLIISGEAEGSTERFVFADRIARQLKEGEHFEIKLKEHQCILTEAGVERAEKLVGVDSFYSNPQLMEWPHLLETALRAHHVYERDKHYIVAQRQGQDGQKSDPEVVIVDEFTGRLMAGRRWSDGLHQAVEAKEGIRPREENRTLATITLQNYFRMFGKLAGMTGTAMTEAAEFSRIYDLDVVSVPSNRPLVRKDYNDQVYLDDDSKFGAIAEEVKRENARGRPILLGTTSIAKSERISQKLTELGVPHNVLNAKQHEREAEIVMQAGRRGMVTVATNMAGRGTDIVLGGKAEALWRAELAQKGWTEGQPEAQARLAELEAHCKKEHDEILALGGLYVIGTERHEARRIDNQLRGRCGRQGDPGETRFFLSFDDDLMRIFARDWVKVMMEKMGFKPGEVIDSPMVTRRIAGAQKKVEARNFDIRKHLLEYDEVMDKQRKFIYGQRQDALEWKGLKDKTLGMVEEVLAPVVERAAANKDEPIDFASVRQWLQHRFGDALPVEALEQQSREGLFDWVVQQVEQLYAQREQLYGEKDWQGVQRFLVLETIDQKWKDHLHAMEVLKGGIGLRSYAQIDPKNEYKKEGFEKFQQLKTEVAEHVVNFVWKQEATDTIRDMITGRLRQQQPPPPPPPPQQPQFQMPRTPQEAQALFESLLAAGQIPQEIVERMQKGERFALRVTPQGLVLQSAGPAQPAPAAGDAPAAPAPTDGAAPADQAPAAPSAPPAPPAAPAAPAPAPAAMRPATPPPAPRPGSQPKPGRNDDCPCGSGIKYKKCCAPAFD